MLPLIAKNIFFGRSLSGNQKNEIASALSLYGYPDKAKEYLNSAADRQYWVEADLLAAEALLGDEKLKQDTIQILLLICNVPSIAPSSKAITYYNIARIYKALDTNDQKSSEYLSSARKLDKSEIEGRLSRDPIFQID